MPVVYSLVCWGGRLGKTVTLTIANPCVVTSSNHGLRNGTGLVFVDNGDTLPSGLSFGTAVYAGAVATNTFNLYDTQANAIAGGATGRIATSGSQSGTHRLQSLYRYSLTDLSRWGSAGAERIYDGLLSWKAGRAGATFADEDVCEIGEAFTENVATVSEDAPSTNIPAGSVTVTSLVDGVRSSAFHNGVIGAGYIIRNRPNQDSTYSLNVYAPHHVVDGISIYGGIGAYYGRGVNVGNLASVVNCIVIGYGTTYGAGVSLNGTYSRAENCLVMNWSTGISLPTYVVGLTLVGNTIAKNAYGIYAVNYQPCYLTAYNNISIGNSVVNYASGVYGFVSCTRNAGLSGEPWTTSGGSAVVMATTDFAGYGGAFAETDNLRAASASSPQVEAATDFYTMSPVDIADAPRPAYMGGAAAYRDIGCYEYDHGYGIAPDYCALSLTNLVVGSAIRIEVASTGDEVESRTAGATTEVFSLLVGAAGSPSNDLRIKVRKASASPFYLPYETRAVISAGAQSIYIAQELDE